VHFAVSTFRPFDCVRAASFSVAIAGGCLAAAPATVAAVRETAVADLVIIAAGHHSGLRQGMACRLSRGDSSVGEVILTEVRPSASSALIVNMAPGQSVRVGDVVSVKTLKTQT